MNDSRPSQLCTGRCGQVKALDQFGPDTRNTNGRQSRCRECRADDERDRRDADRAIVFAHYGAVCSCPGCAATDDLTIDHINGDGGEHRRRANAPASKPPAAR